MYIERHGSGPRTFLGLHGWNGDRNTFAPLLRDLPSDVSFYAADLPGNGRSQRPAQWTLDNIAESIEDAAMRVPAPFTLVGHCSGALLGIYAARRFSERIERMLLIDLFAVLPWYFKIFLAPGFGRYAYATAFANPVGRWMANTSLKAHRTDETSLTAGFAKTDHECTYRYLTLFERFPAPESFRELQMPVDLVYGEKTFQAVKDSVARWKSVWPGARSQELRGAGHLPILEATAQLHRILFQQAECPTPLPTIAS